MEGNLNLMYGDSRLQEWKLKLCSAIKEHLYSLTTHTRKNLRFVPKLSFFNVAAYYALLSMHPV